MIRVVSQTVLQLFDRPTAIPVATVDDADAAVELAQALLRGGLHTLEITLRTGNAMDAVAMVTQQVPNIRIGVGTITRIEQLEQAVAVGASFGVSPGFDEQLAAGARSHDIPYIPGVCTPSELMRSLALGYNAVKVSPVAASGGIDLLKHLSTVFPAARFCPTGGISRDSLLEYLDAPGVFSAGCSWLAPRELIERGDWPAIEELARAATKICLTAWTNRGAES